MKKSSDTCTVGQQSEKSWLKTATGYSSNGDCCRMMGEGFGQTANVLKRLWIQTAEGVVPITLIHLLYDVIIDHITLKCDLQSYCNVNKMCFPCWDYTQFFSAHRLFWGLSLCPFPLPGKKDNFGEWSRDGGGEERHWPWRCWLQFALPKIMCGVRRGIVGLCTRSVLMPFAVIIRVFSPWQC